LSTLWRTRNQILFYKNVLLLFLKKFIKFKEIELGIPLRCCPCEVIFSRPLTRMFITPIQSPTPKEIEVRAAFARLYAMGRGCMMLEEWWERPNPSLSIIQPQPTAYNLAGYPSQAVPRRLPCPLAPHTLHLT